jgi:hypothetical protein
MATGSMMFGSLATNSILLTLPDCG